MPLATTHIKREIPGDAHLGFSLQRKPVRGDAHLGFSLPRIRKLGAPSPEPESVQGIPGNPITRASAHTLLSLPSYSAGLLACAASGPGLRPTREARERIVAISDTTGGGGRLSRLERHPRSRERCPPTGPVTTSAARLPLRQFSGIPGDGHLGFALQRKRKFVAPSPGNPSGIHAMRHRQSDKPQPFCYTHATKIHDRLAA